jgi:exosortase A-associated hydrolase 2
VSGLDPFFLDGPRGRLFAIRRAPGRSGQGRQVLIVPPFAEEMNRSRRMLALQMAAFAHRGIGSLLVDPFGTGDSEGDFAEATWEGWRGDMLAALDWLARGSDGPIGVMGLRLSCFLALEIARGGAIAVDRLILWQPVVSGETAMTQMLRLRLAGEMAVAGDAKLTTKELRSRLAAGEVVEVAGYPLSGALLGAIDRLRLVDMAPPPGPRVDWIEVTQDSAAGIGPAASAVLERWRAAGCDVRPRTVAGDPFWSLQETATVPALVAATAALLAGDDG